MYQITTTNGVIGYTDAPTYCYKLRSGSPQVIGRKERARGETATGVVHGGTVYNLPGYSDFDAETATVSEIDAGAVATAQRGQIIAQVERANAIEAALCEQDTAAAAQLAAIEDALCELDKEEAE